MKRETKTIINLYLILIIFFCLVGMITYFVGEQLIINYELDKECIQAQTTIQNYYVTPEEFIAHPEIYNITPNSNEVIPK